MRYDLTDFEWSIIEPLLPKDRRGRKPGNNRRVLNGIFWVLRAGAPWRDLPERYGPYTTAYNRFNRWRKAGIWDCLMDGIVKAHDGKVQMIDSSIVRVHQHASGVKKRVEIVVWGEAEGASPRRSTRASTPKAARSGS
jgi:transposase